MEAKVFFKKKRRRRETLAEKMHVYPHVDVIIGEEEKISSSTYRIANRCSRNACAKTGCERTILRHVYSSVLT